MNYLEPIDLKKQKLKRIIREKEFKKIIIDMKKEQTYYFNH